MDRVIYCSPLTICWQPLLEHIAISVLETQITVICFNWHYSLARIFRELLSRDHETGNPLAGLSGLSRRSFCEDGSAASAKKMGVPPGNRPAYRGIGFRT
jgi:hypothetical protein